MARYSRVALYRAQNSTHDKHGALTPVSFKKEKHHQHEPVAFPEVHSGEINPLQPEISSGEKQEKNQAPAPVSVKVAPAKKTPTATKETVKVANTKRPAKKSAKKTATSSSSRKMKMSPAKKAAPKKMIKEGMKKKSVKKVATSSRSTKTKK